MQIKRRSISLLLILAMMTIALVSLLPLTAAADPVGDNAADIQDFSYQTLSNANQTDATTDLRVMFTIGSLDYDEVGFVFSTSNSAPTAGGAGTYSTTTVHSTINAGGGNIPAGEGRFWVAVKLHDIPLASFETPIYIRPFVKDGENYSYIDAATITVCEALTFDKTVAGESQLWNSAAPTEGPVNYRYSAGTDTYSISKTIGDIRGSKHFFPTTEDPTYKQLYFEYSFLWNETLANAASARMTLGSLKTHELFGLYIADDAGRSAGSFDLCSGLIDLWGHSTSAVYTGPKDAASFPTLGDRYGWHRIGIVFDNFVYSTPTGGQNPKRAEVDPHKVEYYGMIYLYIDGVEVWGCRANIQGNWSSNQWKNNDGFRPDRAMTFMAYAGELINGEPTEESGWRNEFCVNHTSTTYVDPTKGTILFYDCDTVPVKMTITGIAASENPVYIALSDVHWVCGTGFRRNVSPVADPVDRTITLDDKGTADPSDDVTCSGKIWYVFDNPDND